MNKIQNRLPTDSATVAINSLAQQKAEMGIKVFNLSAGEPRLPPHPLIVQAVSNALEQGKTFYPPVSGIPELKNLACNWMNNEYGCSVQDEHCLVVNGGKLGIYLLLQLMLQKNDEVIIVSPYWVSYPSIITLFGGIPVVIETNELDGWKLRVDQLKQVCTSKTKMLILNNAGNPTGSLYTQDELAELLNIAEEHDLVVVSDEVYSGIIYDNFHYVSCGEFVKHQQRVVIIQSCSKNFSMTGWRVGFVFASSPIIKQLTTLVSQSTSGVTTISQWAAVAALKHASVINSWVKENMESRRNVLVKALNDAFNINISSPSSSLYLFLSLNQLGGAHRTSAEFCKFALDKANVALVPGSAFGKEGFVRMSFGASEDELREGVEALATFCKNIQ